MFTLIFTALSLFHLPTLIPFFFGNSSLCFCSHEVALDSHSVVPDHFHLSLGLTLLGQPPKNHHPLRLFAYLSAVSLSYSLLLDQILS